MSIEVKWEEYVFDEDKPTSNEQVKFTVEYIVDENVEQVFFKNKPGG